MPMEDLLKLFLAIVIGGLLGAEREYHHKAAGLRTIILICVGSTFFTIFSLKLGGVAEQTRIAANIVVGVGFIGAGVILRERGRIVGLTTAATIWIAAALGMGIGGGYYLLSAVTAMIILMVLLTFPRLEDWLDIGLEERTYEVLLPAPSPDIHRIESLFLDNRLRIKNYRQARQGEHTRCTWVAVGSTRKHRRLTEALSKEDDVKELRV